MYGSAKKYTNKGSRDNNRGGKSLHVLFKQLMANWLKNVIRMRTTRCACVLHFLLFLSSSRISCSVWCKIVASTYRVFYISSETTPIPCHRVGKGNLTIFTTLPSNSYKEAVSYRETDGAVFLARSAIHTYLVSPKTGGRFFYRTPTLTMWFLKILLSSTSIVCIMGRCLYYETAPSLA